MSAGFGGTWRRCCAVDIGVRVTWRRVHRPEDEGNDTLSSFFCAARCKPAVNRLEYISTRVEQRRSQTTRKHTQTEVYLHKHLF